MTEEEPLLAETARSKNKDNWYYLFLDEDEFNAYCSIVHKRHWHRDHRIEDDHIDSLGCLPEGFTKSIGPTSYKYNGSWEDAEKMLKLYGITKIEDPFFHF